MNEMMKRCRSIGSSLSILTRFRRSSDAPPVVHAAPAPVIALTTQADPAPVRTLSGTVVRDGAHFALREPDGTLYALDSAGRAWTYEGEDVSISGRIDVAARMLYIQRIEALEDLPIPSATWHRASESA